MTSESTAEKQMRLRYAGVCRLCSAELPAKSPAIWEKGTKTVRCVECPAVEVVEVESRSTEVDSGAAGASARREYERRKAKDEQAVRDRHPRIGGLILALRDERQSTKSWATGATGEEQLGAALDKRVSSRLKVLHDRRIPRSRANIDHIAVTPTGVWVIDPKRYVDKRPELKVEGGILRPRVEKLIVAGRNQTKLVEGATRQVDVLKGIVGPDIAVRGVLCFIEADWPLLGGSFTVNEIDVLWPRKLYPMLGAEGPFDELKIGALHRKLAEALPPA